MTSFLQNNSDDFKTRVGKLEKQLREKEDRENKFKQLALKAKKDAAEAKTKVCFLYL